MANDLTERYDLGIDKGSLSGTFQGACSVTASIDRLQNAMDLRPELDGKPIAPGTEAACPPEGTAERVKMDAKLGNLQNETDSLYSQRSGITLGPKR